MARALFLAAAINCWVGLLLQYVLIVDQLGWGLGTWRFFGFFTILTNCLCAIVASAFMWCRADRLAGPTMRFVASCSIIIVGLVYFLALRAIWHPAGWQKLADHLLHDSAPVLFIAAWLAAPHGQIGQRAIAWALVPPLACLAYALSRGAVDGWYAYWFLDPRTMNAGQLLMSVGAILGAFLLVAVGLTGADHVVRRLKLSSIATRAR